MFTGSVIWRGIIYAILMMLGKLICGLWLIRFSTLPYMHEKFLALKLHPPQIPRLWRSSQSGNRKFSATKKAKKEASSTQQQQQQSMHEPSVHAQHQPAAQSPSTAEKRAESDGSAPSAQHTYPNLQNPLSLYPAAIIGSAMVARGEIGFLVSSLAESKGIFAPELGDSEIFLVVTWAIVLCTIIGPLCVGLLVKRVKRLNRSATEGAVEGRRDVLGVWGVE